MTRTIVRILLVAVFLGFAASSSAPLLADTSPVPLCYPKPCQLQ